MNFPHRLTMNRPAMRPTISVVIPTLNEAKNLPYVLPNIPSWVHEVILVDGRSTDNTVAVAKSLISDIRVVYQQGKGKGAALRNGFAAATGDIVVMLDADGSMSPGEIPAFVGLLLTGADYAKGSRFLQGGGTNDMEWIRFLGNRWLTWIVRLGFGGQYSDLCYGYNAFWRRILPDLQLDATGFEIETQMNVRILQAGLKVCEVPSFERARIHGFSNLNTFRDGWRVLKIIFAEWLQPRITLRPRVQPHYASAGNAGSINIGGGSDGNDRPGSHPLGNLSTSARSPVYGQKDTSAIGMVSEG